MDLAEIAAYLHGEASDKIALRTVKDILARLDQAALFPHAGAPRDYLWLGLRMVLKHHYAAYYFTTTSEIVVARVLHGARDVEALSESGGITP